MRKTMIAAMLALSVVMMTACGAKVEGTGEAETGNVQESVQEQKTVTIQSLNEKEEVIEVEVPFQPQKIAVMDMAALDIIDAIGEGDKVAGASEVSVSYLEKYEPNGEIINLGTIKEADMEALAKVKPDVIFIGGRLAESYEKFSEIAPVVYLSVSGEERISEMTAKNAKTIASIFGKEELAAELMSGYTERIETIKEKASGQNAILGLVTGGTLNVLGNDGRCSIIGKEMGFENIGIEEEADTSTHGNEASFEYIVKKNPEYLFVLDRDAAIGKEGASLAKDIVENDLIKDTDVYKNGKIVYLANPTVWYMAEGGITALDIMIQDIEAVWNE